MGVHVYMTVSLLSVLYHYVMASLPLFIALDLKPILSNLRVAGPAVLGFHSFRTYFLSLPPVHTHFELMCVP